MILFGASMLSWIAQWTESAGSHAIRQASQAGFDLLEISLPADLDSFDVSVVNKQLRNCGIKARCTFILPKDCHPPLHPRAASLRLKKAIDIVYAMGGDFLGGVLYGAIGSFTGMPPGAHDRTIVYNLVSEAANYAKEKAITLALEPINRYETYIFTSLAEISTFIQSTGLENVGILADTFHMNIEESGFYQPIIDVGPLLRHVHITESDRGMPGEGNVHWDDFFRALAVIKFDGVLALENFSSEIKELIKPTSLWRPSKYGADELARGSLQFMKQKASQYGLI